LDEVVEKGSDTLRDGDPMAREQDLHIQGPEPI
jgi:hypothetical protein